VAHFAVDGGLMDKERLETSEQKKTVAAALEGSFRGSYRA